MGAFVVGCEILGRVKTNHRENIRQHICSCDTVVVLTKISEKSMYVGCMVARLKLKGIDGRAPPGVELHSTQHGKTHQVSTR